MSERQDFKPDELLRRLLAADVRFVVIGGLAAQAYGTPSLTADLKRAAGRPKDRVELEILGALREEIDRAPTR